MPKRWDDIDKIVKLYSIEDSKHISLSEFAIAILDNNYEKQKHMIKILKGQDEKYTAEIFPLEGLLVSVDLHLKRFKDLVKNKGEQELINQIYTQARKIEKEKKKKEIKVVFENNNKKEEKTQKTKKTQKREKPPKKEIEKNIKFSNLKCKEGLEHFIPEKDKNYAFPEFADEFSSFLDNGVNIWLHGGTGAGKSSLVEQVCAIGKIPLMYCSFHEDIKPDQLFGGFRLLDGNTIWQDGPITKAYREGLVLLLDEIDGLPPEIAFSLYAVTDNKPLVLAENNNEVIMPHKNFRVVATGNTHGRGDETGMYSGTNMLNRAFLNRFRVWYQVEYPKKNTYKQLMLKEGLDDRKAEIISTFAKEINESFCNGSLSETFSIRDAREIARVTKILNGDIRRALEITLMNRLSSIEKASVNELFMKLF